MGTADELAKLDALRKSGVLTQGEFDGEKAKLLAGVPPSSASGSPQLSGAEAPQGGGWWQASNGQWYAPVSHPDYRLPSASSSPTADRRTLLSPTQASPVVGSESSVAAKSGFRRTKPLILASACTIVVVIAAVSVIVSLGKSTNSPSSVATKWSSSYTKGHAGTVCSALLPSQRAGCISVLKGEAVTTKSFGIGRVHTEGDRALVVTTGSSCTVGGGCSSNFDRNLGFDSGHSFPKLWAIVTSPNSNPSAEIVRFWVFIVPTQKENGTWYVTMPLLASTSTGAPSSTTTGGGSGKQDTDAESNLQTALTGADTFFTYANQSYTGIMGGTQYSSITEIDTGLSYVGASTTSINPSTISIRESAGLVVEMTAYAPSSGICYGILDIKGPTDTPVFPEYPETTANGTYYFSNQQGSSGYCTATITSADTLSSYGW
jgi:hypothetical protein